VFGNFPLDEKNTVVYIDFPLFFATERALVQYAEIRVASAHV
jgi:hypothetical protein